MTMKTAQKNAARARQRLHGGKYQRHLRELEACTPRILITRAGSSGELETTAVDVVTRGRIALVRLTPWPARGAR
jgi:hypothetical protein